jgi:multidrug efflux pump subunit AcrA (membrane-fusion protein)
MIRKYILPLIALLGVAFAIYTVRASQKQLPAADPVAPPPTSDFNQQIAGAGIVEARSENIQISAVVPGMVEAVYAQVGDSVQRGQKLFSVETRDLQAQLIKLEAAVKGAEARLAKLKESPRAEDIPPAAARVAELKASLADREDQLKRLALLRSRNAVGEDEYNRSVFAVDVAKAQLAGAEADLARIKAGAWAPDIAIAQSDLDSAEADVEALKIEWDRRTVYSPIDGKVLQAKVRAGEFASTGVLAQSLMLIGDIEVMHVRVDIDENDAWRLKRGASATGSLRGNSELKSKLSFVRVEPYVVPKRSLTGESTERVDTRVLQVIYKVEDANFPVFVGQQMDVFIDASTKDASH